MRTPAREAGGRRRFPQPPASGLLLLPPALCLLLSACLPVTRPIVKIALVAPFEGRYRDVGYEVIYAVRLAVREANAAGGIAGHSVELMAFDDGGVPAQAQEQARKIGVDPLVVGAIGHWLDETTLAAAPIYDTEGIPLLATSSGALPDSAFRLWLTDAELISAAFGENVVHCTYPCGALDDLRWLIEGRRASPGDRYVGPPLWGQSQFHQLAGASAEGVHFVAPAPLPADSADPSFAERYRQISTGVEPRSYSVLAYDAARVLFDAIARDIRANRRPSREGTAAALHHTSFDGLSGHISFDSSRDWEGARGWAYRWSEGKIVGP